MEDKFWKVTLITNLGKDAPDCAVEMQKLIMGKATIKNVIKYKPL